jgi:glucose-1-phosphate thymidylyltransferase
MDKVVVLARGLGTRMRKAQEGEGLSEEQERVAETGVKALVPIDRPFLDYVLTEVAEAGYRRICLVIGPEHDELRRYYGQQVEAQRLSFEFAEQAEPLGTADAVAAARDFAGVDPFLMINSDNVYPAAAVAALRDLDGPGLIGFERQALLRGNIPAERVERFAVVDVDDENNLNQVVEKPSPDQLSALPEPVGVSMNCWRFDGRIFTACAAIEPSARGELEITTAVQHAIDQLGVRFRVVALGAPVLDLTSRDDIDSVGRWLRGKAVRL